MFKNEDQSAKYTTISTLGKLKSEDAITCLLEAVKNGNPQMVNKIFSTFCENKLLFKELLTRLSNDKNLYLRGFAALGYGEIGDKHDIEALSYLLRDKEPYVRGKAVHALGNINYRYNLDQYAINMMAERMSDCAPYVRANAAYSLSKIRIEDPLIISEIEKLLYDSDPYVRDSAIYALKEGNYACSFELLDNALKNEKETWIRFNIILALGSIKGFHKIGSYLMDYFPLMSLPLYNLVCNPQLWDQEQSPILPLYVASFCTKSKSNEFLFD